MEQKAISVKDVMTKQVVTVTPDTSLLKASELMTKYNFNGLPVVDKDKKVVGILTEYDMLTKGTAMHLPTFLKLFGQYPDHQKDEYAIGTNLGEILAFTVKDVMNPEPLMTHAEASLLEIVELFEKHHRVNPIPVVEKSGVLAGIVSRYDIIRCYSKMLSGRAKTMDETLHKSADRSVLNFVIFIVIAVTMTLFLLGEAEKTINEIDALQDTLKYGSAQNIIN